MVQGLCRSSRVRGHCGNGALRRHADPMPDRRRRDCIGTPHPVRSPRQPSQASWRPSGDCQTPDTIGRRCSARSAAGRRAQGFACRALPRRSSGLLERRAWLWPQAQSGSPSAQPCRAPRRPADLFGSCCIIQCRNHPIDRHCKQERCESRMSRVRRADADEAVAAVVTRRSPKIERRPNRLLVRHQRCELADV